MKTTLFNLEPLGEIMFKGFTSGRRWNGLACPGFTKDEADRIVEVWHKLGYKADYDAVTDVFRFAPFDSLADPNLDWSDEEVVEHFGPIEVDGWKLYPIGAGAWIWDEVEGLTTVA